MTPLLEQFLSESRDVLQGVGEKLIQLESTPDDAGLMDELFRLVHTLKGNCGLFAFPEMLRTLHAAEDVMAVVRGGDLAYSQELADRLLEAMDYVSVLCDEIEATGHSSATHAAASVQLAESLRQLIVVPSVIEANTTAQAPVAPEPAKIDDIATVLPLWMVPEALRVAWQGRASTEPPLLWVNYTPRADCFFNGEDPFHQARQTPEIAWQRVTVSEPWPPLEQLDAYHCVLIFQMISTATRAAIEEHFRYVSEQITITAVPPMLLAAPVGEEHAVSGGARAEVVGSTASAQSVYPISVEPISVDPIAVDPIVNAVIAAQYAVLSMPDQVLWLPGRLKAVASTLAGCFRSLGRDALLPTLDAALAASLTQASAVPLLAWLGEHAPLHSGEAVQNPSELVASSPALEPPPAIASDEPRFERRATDATNSRTLKVDQDKIDRLMNLIGEMVVAKNGLPFLARRAESVFGVRELAREIKTQYAVINRIADEMQSAIMQVRMTPVSFVFQRFPRLVRDISRKLGKEVTLVLQGEDTEADKNIIESLADPLIHIVRNSLDHGIELPEVRRAAGKPAEGRLVIRASQEADRVVIDISDDGRGIDPVVIKRKAYSKGLIDENTLEHISDQDAINLVFAAGFSTVDVVSDLSGRGVGMDVVRAAVENVHGTVALSSTVGHGTRLRLSLPLSMAVTNVMIIESADQAFGVPMDMVVETVRIPRVGIHLIKDCQTAVLRDRIVPLHPLNRLLANERPQRPNDKDELATLVIRMQGEHVGIVVDNFREVVDIILKPMAGILGGLPGYAGSALLGDGSVLMVLNPQELV